MAMWNPWRGCRKFSEGCRYCYIHKGDYKRNLDTNQIIKTEDFYAPVRKRASGEYNIKPNQLVYVCFSSDFLIAEADEWRAECWDMMKQRSDLHFLFLTKRIERFLGCIPNNWGDGYDNVTVGCTIENRETAEQRLKIFDRLPIKHKNIICQPLLEGISVEPYLNDVELVVVGGESDKNARPLDYSWVLDIRQACQNKRVEFMFRQCGTHFIKDGRKYTLQTKDLCKQAKKANINLCYTNNPER